MTSQKRYRSASRSVSDLKAHLVLTNKYGVKCINLPILSRLEEVARNLAEKWGVEVIELNGESDHIHLLFAYYPQLQLSKFINNFKTVINKEFPDHLGQFWWKKYPDSKGQLWNNSYAIHSVGGANLEVLERYVRGLDSPEC
ncbi:MAG: IS200/IS605 family transposase [Cyanobacteria bacterium QS_3_48_167]|nr:MAG: IS200/IS605 family transposase [Cyanobacteria bacterium QS_3_48_167]